MQMNCPRCDRTYSVDPLRFRCDCGGPLTLDHAPSFDPKRITCDDRTLWRYRHALPLPEGAAPVTLGEGGTPVVPAEWKGLPIHLKCEHLNPTGSFKDRGTTLLMTVLKAAGATTVVEDSSGNAGASLAAYAARAGIRARVYVPAHASPVKQAQIAAYGAQIERVPGPRVEAARAVLKTAQGGAAYASHVYHPLIHHGMKTIAFELAEGLASPPDAVVVPVGHGTLLLGLALGFAELRATGAIERVPRLFGAQAAACAPLARAWAESDTSPAPVDEGETIAEGVRIAVPLRGPEVLAAVRESEGAFVAVTDEETRASRQRLAHQGVYVEPTSAVALAAIDHLRDQLTDTVVVVLTGSGFKSPT